MLRQTETMEHEGTEPIKFQNILYNTSIQSQ